MTSDEVLVCRTLLSYHAVMREAIERLQVENAKLREQRDEAVTACKAVARLWDDCEEPDDESYEECFKRLMPLRNDAERQIRAVIAHAEAK